MPPNGNIEERLAALERAVAELQRKLDGTPPNGNWLDKVIGSISDVEAFDEVIEYGKAYRNADRPPDDGGESA